MQVLTSRVIAEQCFGSITYSAIIVYVLANASPDQQGNSRTVFWWHHVPSYQCLCVGQCKSSANASKRPRKNWVDVIKRDLRQMDLAWEEAEELANDKAEWC